MGSTASVGRWCLLVLLQWAAFPAASQQTASDMQFGQQNPTAEPRRFQAKAASEVPCTTNRFGTDTVREGVFDFEGVFTMEHREMFHKNGYIVMRNLIPREIIQKFRQKYFSNDNVKKFGTPMCGHGCAGQPQRLKMHIEESVLFASLKAFRPGLFMAYNLVKGEPRATEMDNTTNFERAISEMGHGMHSHNNVALPGAVYQNPHWDVSNTYPKIEDMVLMDVPLVDVTYKNAPLEIWKSTHRVDYKQLFDDPDPIVRTPNTFRQYWHCFEGMVDAARQRPSAIVRSTAGDAVLRNPSTWHRGTPNNETSARDMITILMMPKGRGKGKGKGKGKV